MQEAGGSTILRGARGARPDPMRLGGAMCPAEPAIWRAPEPGGETTRKAMAKTPPEKRPPATDSDEKAAPAQGAGATSARSRSPESAFDMWLQRELQKMFSEVAQEPIPDDLLRLIDQDKLKRK